MNSFVFSSNWEAALAAQQAGQQEDRPPQLGRRICVEEIPLTSQAFQAATTKEPAHVLTMPVRHAVQPVVVAEELALTGTNA